MNALRGKANKWNGKRQVRTGRDLQREKGG
jgi:hypothetical protein